jgi:hypothetical protein
VSPLEIADPVTAVAAYLKLKMGDSVGGRVYRPELPRSIDSKMPTPAIVLMPAGAGKLTSGNRWPIMDSLIDIICYAAARQQGDELAREAQLYLREFNSIVSAGVLLYWARETSGIIPGVESDVNWVTSEITVQVLHSTMKLAA